jgi:hypothetical protein
MKGFKLISSLIIFLSVLMILPSVARAQTIIQFYDATVVAVLYANVPSGQGVIISVELSREDAAIHGFERQNVIVEEPLVSPLALAMATSAFVGRKAVAVWMTIEERISGPYLQSFHIGLP